MGLIVKKDFAIGKDIKCYMRIAKLEFSLKEKKWDCVVEFFLDVESVNWKKVNKWIKEWVLDNQEKITDYLWDFLEDEYLNKDRNIIPIGGEKIQLESIFSPWDFENENAIFEWIYEQIKQNPHLIKADVIYEDVIDDIDVLTKKVKKEIDSYLNEKS